MHGSSSQDEEDDYLFVITQHLSVGLQPKGKNTWRVAVYYWYHPVSETQQSFFLSFRQQQPVNAPALFLSPPFFTTPSTQRRWNYFPSRSKQLLIWIRLDVKDNGNPSLYWQIVTRNIIRMNQVRIYNTHFCLYLCVCARTTMILIYDLKCLKQQLVLKPNLPFYFQRNAKYPSTTMSLLLRIDPQHILFHRHHHQHHHHLMRPTCMKMIHPIISPCLVLWMSP